MLVKVNGDIITKTELEQRQVAVLRSADAGPAGRSRGAEERRAAEEGARRDHAAAARQRGRRAAARCSAAASSGCKLGDDQFKQVVGNIRKEQGLTDEAKFQAALAQEGMTMDDLRKQLERQMLIEQVQRQEVGSKLSITEEEARQYYAQAPEEFTDPASVTLREIFIEVPGGRRRRRQRRAKTTRPKKKIEDVRARALKGEDFAKVAAEVSDVAVEGQRRPDRAVLARRHVAAAPGSSSTR